MHALLSISSLTFLTMCVSAENKFGRIVRYDHARDCQGSPSSTNTFPIGECVLAQDGTYITSFCGRNKMIATHRFSPDDPTCQNQLHSEESNDYRGCLNYADIKAHTFSVYAGCDYEYEKYCGLSQKVCTNCADCFQHCKDIKKRGAQKLCRASCIETKGDCSKDKTCECQEGNWKAHCTKNIGTAFCAAKCRKGTGDSRLCRRKCKDCTKSCKKKNTNGLDRLLCTLSCADSQGECNDDNDCACFPIPTATH